MTSSKIAYRAGRNDDMAYVVSTWRRLMMEGRDNKLLRDAFKVDDNVIYRGITSRINRLVERSTIRIACDSEQDTNIVGFAVYEEKAGIGVGHFRYVRDKFRSMGIAKKLVDVPILVCTHRDQGHGRSHQTWTYNPFLLEG